MTRDEFDADKGILMCKDCGHVGLEAQHNQNNNGVRPVCPECRSVTPLAGISWLPKAKAKTPARGAVDTRAVWEANGNHCSFCGKSRELCEQLGIGLTAQHVVPFVEGADDWPLIPFCATCQQSSAAALKEGRQVKALVDKLTNKDGESDGDVG